MMVLVRNGVMPDPDGREPWFPCAALTEEDVGETLNYFSDAVTEITGS
jgi:glutamate-1-semialdehyde aminotransferase